MFIALAAVAALSIAPADLLDPAAAGRFLGELPAEVASRLDADLAAFLADGPEADVGRLPAFVLAGCQNVDAHLLIEPGSLSAVLVDSHVDCAEPDYYVAVFDLPSDHLPPGVEIG